MPSNVPNIQQTAQFLPPTQTTPTHNLKNIHYRKTQTYTITTNDSIKIKCILILLLLLSSLFFLFHLAVWCVQSSNKINKPSRTFGFFFFFLNMFYQQQHLKQWTHTRALTIYKQHLRIFFCVCGAFFKSGKSIFIQKNFAQTLLQKTKKQEEL